MGVGIEKIQIQKCCLQLSFGNNFHTIWKKLELRSINETQPIIIIHNKVETRLGNFMVLYMLESGLSTYVTYTNPLSNSHSSLEWRLKLS